MFSVACITMTEVSIGQRSRAWIAIREKKIAQETIHWFRSTLDLCRAFATVLETQLARARIVYLDQPQAKLSDECKNLLYDFRWFWAHFYIRVCVCLYVRRRNVNWCTWEVQTRLRTWLGVCEAVLIFPIIKILNVRFVKKNDLNWATDLRNVCLFWGVSRFPCRFARHSPIVFGSWCCCCC